LSLYETLNDQRRGADLHPRPRLFRSSPRAHKNLPPASMHLHKAEAVLSKGPSSGRLAAMYFGLGQLARCELRTRGGVDYLRRATEVAGATGTNDVWCASVVQYGLYLSQIGRLSEGRAIALKVWERISTIESPLSTFSAYHSGGGISSELCDQRGAREW